MNRMKIFEGQDVKIKTGEGNILINLIHIAKCCGLTREDRGYLKIRWTDIKDKLSFIGNNYMDEGSSKNYLEEINYILDEIENTDDRNTIYISRRLAKRLAIECHSEKAMRFKDFLVDMDESREKQNTFNEASALEQFSIATEQMAIIGKAVQGLQKITLNMQEYVKDSINIKDSQIDEIRELVGLRTVNVVRLTYKLKEVLRVKYRCAISANSTIYQEAKKRIFNEFKVMKWEEIPVVKFNEVFAFIEEAL